MSLEEAIRKNTEAILALTAKFGVVDEDEVVKQKRKRRTKAEIAADKEAVNTHFKEARKKDIPLPPPVTLDMLRAEASAVVELDNTEAQKGLVIAQKIITKAGYKKISDIPEDKRNEIVSEFREAVKSWKKQ
jgi:hypothetical protein